LIQSTEGNSSALEYTLWLYIYAYSMQAYTLTYTYITGYTNPEQIRRALPFRRAFRNDTLAGQKTRRRTPASGT